MEVNAVIPLFRIFDLKKAREFYLDYLGFEVDWEHTFEPGMPVYMQISRSKGLVLHLTEHYGDCCPGSTAYIRVGKGLKEFHEEISCKGYSYLRPGIKKEEWGEISVELIDPFGNRLRFGERINAEDKGKQNAPQH